MMLVVSSLKAVTVSGKQVFDSIPVIKDQRGANIEVGMGIFPVRTRTEKLIFHTNEMVSVFDLETEYDSKTEIQKIVALKTTTIQNIETTAYIVLWHQCSKLVHCTGKTIPLFCTEDEQFGYALVILQEGGNIFSQDGRVISNIRGKLHFQLKNHNEQQNEARSYFAARQTARQLSF